MPSRNCGKGAVVTGGAGFLGPHLCERLVELGHRVICVDNFVTGPAAAHAARRAAFTAAVTLRAVRSLGARPGTQHGTSLLVALVRCLVHCNAIFTAVVKKG